MRSREEILKDGKRIDLLTLEVLLDIRELLGFKETVKAEETKPSLLTTERKERKKRKKKRKYTRKVLGADSKRLLKNSV